MERSGGECVSGQTMGLQAGWLYPALEFLCDLLPKVDNLAKGKNRGMIYLIASVARKPLQGTFFFPKQFHHKDNSPGFTMTRWNHLHGKLVLRISKELSLPGSSIHRILQARILEWVAMTSSR